jgi:hypothetical protein
MKHSWKTIFGAALFAATAQAAGAQALPQPPASCTVQTLSGSPSWTCAIATFATPIPGSFTVMPGMVIPPTNGTVFGFVEELQAVYGKTPNSIYGDIPVSLPNPTTGAPTATRVFGIITATALPQSNALTFYVSAISHNALRKYLAYGPVSNPQGSIWLLQFQNGKWLPRLPVPMLHSFLNVLVADQPDAQTGLYRVDIH